MYIIYQHFDDEGWVRVQKKASIGEATDWVNKRKRTYANAQFDIIYTTPRKRKAKVTS